MRCNCVTVTDATILLYDNKLCTIFIRFVGCRARDGAMIGEREERLELAGIEERTDRCVQETPREGLLSFLASETKGFESILYRGTRTETKLGKQERREEGEGGGKIGRNSIESRWTSERASERANEKKKKSSKGETINHVARKEFSCTHNGITRKSNVLCRTENSRIIFVRNGASTEPPERKELGPDKQNVVLSSVYAIERVSCPVNDHLFRMNSSTFWTKERWITHVYTQTHADIHAYTDMSDKYCILNTCKVKS